MDISPKYPSKEPGRNEPCWCGSEIKFKHCHLHRSTEDPLPQGLMLKELSKIRMKGRCLYPVLNNATCHRPIMSHTLSKSAALSAITDKTNHVLTFYPPVPNKEGGMVLHKTGINEASTFLGFCNKHDSQLFAPIEREAFSFSPEQCFLHAYRTISHELYQKQSVLDSNDYMCRNLDRGTPFPLQKQIQTYLYVQKAGLTKGLENVVLQKSKLDEFLLAKEFSFLSHVAINFKGKVCILTAGTPTPNRDITGKEIQTLHELNNNIQYLSVVIIPNLVGGSILLSWQSSSLVIRNFVDQIINLPQDTVVHFIVQYIFKHLENTFFSSDWWNNMSPEIQKHMTSLATISNPYYSRTEFFQNIEIPWQVIEIKKINININ
jgi:hypothetical protein